MKTITKICASFGIAFTIWSNCLASDTGTHGGNAIVCGTDTGQKYELLDYYDAKLTQLNGYKVDLGPEGSVMDHIGYVLNRLSKIDSVAAKRFSERAKIFMDEMKFLTPAEMKKVADTNELVNPNLGCEKQQFAVQVFNPLPGQARYFVNEEIWSNAGNTTRAGLILHEVILRDGVEMFQQSTSDKSSYYNSQISSSAMNDMTPEQYARIVNASFGSTCAFSIPKYGMHVCIKDEVREYDGRTRIDVAEGSFKSDQGFVFTPDPTDKDVMIWLDAQGKLTNASGFEGNIRSHGLLLKAWPTEFESNHHISLAWLNTNEDHTLSGITFNFATSSVHFDKNYHFTDSVYVVANQSVSIGETQVPMSINFREITFFPNGRLKTFFPATVTTVKVGNYEVPTSTGGQITLNDDGSVKQIISGELNEGKYLVNGQNLRMSAVEFNPDGTIRSGNLAFDSSIRIAGRTVDISKNTDFYPDGNVSYTHEIDSKTTLTIGKTDARIERPFVNDWAFYENGSVAYGMLPEAFENFSPEVFPNCLKVGLSTTPGVTLPYGSWGDQSAFYAPDGRVCYLSKSYVEDKNPNKMWDAIQRLNAD